jgi:hypothetical protein
MESPSEIIEKSHHEHLEQLTRIFHTAGKKKEKNSSFPSLTNV